MGHPVFVREKPVRGKFTMDNSCMEMMDSSFVMRIQYRVTKNIIGKQYPARTDDFDPAYRMTLISALDCPLRAVVINSGGRMKGSLAAGLLYMANGHYLKGIGALLRKDKTDTR